MVRDNVTQKWILKSEKHAINVSKLAQTRRLLIKLSEQGRNEIAVELVGRKLLSCDSIVKSLRELLHHKTSNDREYDAKCQKVRGSLNTTSEK